MDHRLTFPCESDRAVRLLEQVLARRGLTVVRSFDIRGRDGETCGCGSAGGQPCRCHFAVLLVFGPPGLPAVVTARGCNGEATLEVAFDPNAAVDNGLVETTLQALHAAAADARLAGPANGPGPDARHPQG
jgi:hypothetical protein